MGINTPIPTDKNRLSSNYPKLASQWHPIKNGYLTPDKVVAGSNKKCWWQCPKGHEWEVSPNNRTSHQNGCPYCTNQKVFSNNCLSNIFPEIAVQWHLTLNGGLTPDQVIAKSPKKYWWQCSKFTEHAWKASPNNRTSQQNGCPYCNNQKVWSGNSLATLFSETTAEWHPTKNGNITPDQVIAGSHKKYWWQCKKGHEWEASTKSRTYGNRGCPTCKESKGEKQVAKVLTKMNKKFEKQVKFDSCRFILPLPFDFGVYENDKVILIEYHGKQHYKPQSFGSKQPNAANELFRQIKIRDKEKCLWAKYNKIPLLVIPYWDFGLIEKRINAFIDLINAPNA